MTERRIRIGLQLQPQHADYDTIRRTASAAEDLDRGRLYLPSRELAAFGVTRELLEARRPDPRIRAALAYFVARTRAVYRRAEAGVALLRPESRPCVRTALTLYEGILDEIVALDYDILTRRAVVPKSRRLVVAGPALVRAAWRR